VLNLNGFVVDQVAETTTQYDVTVKVDSPAPPCCLAGVVLNGTKTVMFRDLPIHGKHVGIWVNRQRYKCRGCGKTLYQGVPHMSPKHEMTERMVRYIERNSLDRTFSALATELGLSEFAVRGIFRAYAKQQLSELEPVTLYPVEIPRCRHERQGAHPGRNAPEPQQGGRAAVLGWNPRPAEDPAHDD
jgi:transposase